MSKLLTMLYVLRNKYFAITMSTIIITTITIITTIVNTTFTFVNTVTRITIVTIVDLL